MAMVKMQTPGFKTAVHKPVGYVTDATSHHFLQICYGLNPNGLFLQIQITGNKMTSLNLATIFGPNLLHKQKSSDKEFSVQSSARAEESTAVIAVLQRMIASYQTLFMVSHWARVSPTLILASSFHSSTPPLNTFTHAQFPSRIPMKA